MKVEKCDDIRCPWCGEKYIDTSDEAEQLDNSILFCGKCERYGKQNKKVWEKVLFAIVWIYCISGIVFFFRPVNFFWIGPIVIMSVIAIRIVEIVLPKKFPVYRFDIKNNIVVDSEKCICHADIRWYPVIKGGILFYNFRLWSNMIFPMCFVDKEEIPISQMGCVRLVKKHFYDWKQVKLYGITDYIKPEAIEEGQKFYIFNEKKRIGEGIVSYK